VSWRMRSNPTMAVARAGPLLVLTGRLNRAGNRLGYALGGEMVTAKLARRHSDTERLLRLGLARVLAVFDGEPF
jgi:hypothetical protein